MLFTNCNTRIVKHFYGNNFKVFIELSEAGGLSGVLHRGPGKYFEREASVTGMYQAVNNKIGLTFFTSFAQILTCYAGEIVKYNNNEECLLLKCLQINELFPTPGAFSTNETLVLFDSPKKNQIQEIKKILQEYPLEFFNSESVLEVFK